jgi:uncharacterized membrane protein
MHLTAICATLAAALFGSALTAIADPMIEPGINRTGGDYRSFDVGDADLRDHPELSCQIACQKEAQCKAWTYVKIGVQGPKAKCWLKTGLPAATANNCCTSGVKDGIEPGINRAGGDYRSFDVGNADLRDHPELSCQIACRKEAQCKSWTYVKIGVQGPKAKCWLKSSIPAASANACCTSGSR